MEFIKWFNEICKAHKYKCEITENCIEQDGSRLYSCTRGEVKFEYYVEFSEGKPIHIQYNVIDFNEDHEYKYYENDSSYYENDSCSELTEDDIKECIEWLLEEVDIVYRVDCKIRKKLGSIFDSIETADELRILRNIFEELASNY
jgi:hypothetical protein